MKIDCQNQECPKPVLETKKALEALPKDATLEVIVNSNASKENVIRFAKNAGYTVEDESLKDGATKITIVKGYDCAIESEDNSEFLNKVLFLKDDKVGEGELGGMLAVGFLKNILELPALPKKIICVNKAVLLTTAPKDSDIINVLKALEEKGVEIYSCGICLQFYKVEDELKVGVIGNAYDTVLNLLNSEGTITL